MIGEQPWMTGLKVKPMPKIDDYESEVLAAFDKGQLKSVASKFEFAKIEAAARATAETNVQNPGSGLLESDNERPDPGF